MPSVAGRRYLDGLDVGRRGTLRALLGLEAHLRALGERPEAAALDRAVMYEHVLAGVIRRDEAEALVVGEPLHGSGCHLAPLFVRCAAKARRQRLRERGHCSIERSLDA